MATSGKMAVNNGQRARGHSISRSFLFWRKFCDDRPHNRPVPPNYSRLLKEAWIRRTLHLEHSWEELEGT